MITPVHLCGGSGTRLWPLSRKSFPKQFATFHGDQSLFQASARRLTGKSFASLTCLRCVLAAIGRFAAGG